MITYPLIFPYLYICTEMVIKTKVFEINHIYHSFEMFYVTIIPDTKEIAKTSPHLKKELNENKKNKQNNKVDFMKFSG